MKRTGTVMIPPDLVDDADEVQEGILLVDHIVMGVSRRDTFSVARQNEPMLVPGIEGDELTTIHLEFRWKDKAGNFSVNAATLDVFISDDTPPADAAPLGFKLDPAPVPQPTPTA